jgi:hypothetical protein
MIHKRTPSDASRRSPTSSQGKAGENPFGDDYDESMNPFAEDDDEGPPQKTPQTTIQATQQPPRVKDQPINPFGEDEDDDYNDTLNPFAE